jgi:hypothetical protein
MEFFGAMEGIYFEFTSLNWFWKIWKNIKPHGACLSAPLFQQQRPERGRRRRACHRHHLTWL